MENDQGEEETGISQEPPTSVIVTNLTTDIFDEPGQRAMFERLFQDIDENVTFQYFKSFRRVRVNFTNNEQATQAREKFHMTEFRDEIIKCYFTQPIVLGNREGGPHLQPPQREKQFLISPPASPPVGWEPIEEAEPIINYDLVAAVAKLAPGVAHELHPAEEDKPSIYVHICHDQEEEMEEEDGVRTGAKRRIIQTRRPT
ncbi:hypothetical protein Pmani_005021 [Petrolisthes manimaculis]|uniref:Calcipressin-1 n=1 Tax=Petrolisthes manimaculis TaxID=1843537 RepID=A0AAE1UHX1_9EUCA|nr:hypothetical protein Pmani_005021 [Petrolisthes manimaculis]